MLARAEPAARLAGLGRWPRLGLAALAGAGMTLGQPPVSFPWALFLALPLLVWLIDGAPRPSRAFAIGWAAAFGYFVSGLHWIGFAFLVDADQFAWMMPFAVTLLPAFLGLFWGTAFWLTARLCPPGWPRAVALAGWLTLVEFARSYMLTGFPWALPGYVWVDTPVAQAAAWAGPFGLTLLTLVLTALPLVGLAARGWASRAAGALAALALAALWLAGAARLGEVVAPAADAPVLRLVQPNAIQALKWHPDWMGVFYRRLLEETQAPPDPALGPPDAVIWPETAVPFLPAEAPERRAEIVAAAGGARMIFGALHRPRPGGRLTNSLMALGWDGEIVRRYDKHHLVPFGEYLPYPGILGRIGMQQLVPGRGFLPGPGPQTIELPGLPPFSPLICYEMIFPQEVVAPGPRPAWLLQVTNDAWFGRFAGPQQHLAQARMRAIEQGLPVVRAANTGISAVIDARGRVLASLALGTYGHLDARLPPAAARTLYSRIGDWPAILLAALMALIGTLAMRVVPVK